MTPQVQVLERGPWLSAGPTRRAEWLRVTLPLPHGPHRPIRLMHLSDLHLRGQRHPVLDRVMARLQQELFDAVLFTGDLMDDKFDSRPHLAAMVEPALPFRSRFGAFGIPGNHDGDLVRPWFGRLGVTCIEGRHLRLQDAGVRLDLVGLPGAVREADPGFFDRDRDPAVPTLALSHFPDAVQRCGRLRPDVVLAGHTHGGQIALPGRIPIITHDSLPRRMCSGVHVTEHCCLIVSRGIGYTEIPVRLFAPPQVIELVLTRCGD